MKCKCGLLQKNTSMPCWTALMDVCCVLASRPIHANLFPHLARAVGALRKSAAAALTPAEAARWSSQAERLVRRRAGLSQRWDAAFATLHTELESLRRCLAAWACARRANPDRDPGVNPGASAAVGGVPMSCA